MFSQMQTQRGLTSDKNSSKGSSRNLLVNSKSQNIIGSRTDRNSKDYGPGPMTYVIDFNGISN